MKKHTSQLSQNKVMTDGSEFETRSTWGKEMMFKLDIDPKSHYVDWWDTKNIR